MKYLKLFESHDEIDRTCKEYGIKNYHINPDGSVDVNGDVNLSCGKLTTKIPIKFGRVSGNFTCQWNSLTTLEGCPRSVAGYFDCRLNDLTTLEGGPEEVGGGFYFSDNPIYNLYELFGDLDIFKKSLDFKYLRGRDIVKLRFKEACLEAGIKMPESVEGYNYN